MKKVSSPEHFVLLLYLGMIFLAVLEIMKIFEKKCVVSIKNAVSIPATPWTHN